MARLRQSQQRRIGSGHRAQKPSIGRARNATLRSRKSNASTTKAADPTRETAHTGIAQSRNSYQGVSAATTSAPVFIKNGYSTAVDNMRAYNNKLVEFTHANMVAAFDFAQKLSSVNSPLRFIELSAEHARRQFETLTEQTKQLIGLAQRVTLPIADPQRVPSLAA
jgi:phasin